MAAQGIDLAALSKYKALLISGELTGSNSKKIINTDPNTLLVIVVWYGPQTRSNQETADNVGLPLVRETVGATELPAIHIPSLEDISNKKEREYQCKKVQFYAKGNTTNGQAYNFAQKK